MPVPADGVVAGSTPLDKAYETVRDRKRATESPSDTAIRWYRRHTVVSTVAMTSNQMT